LYYSTYIRVGSTNRQASLETLEELEQQRRKISFDAEPVYDFHGSDSNLSLFIKDFQDKTGLNIDQTKLQNLGLIIQEQSRT